MTIHKKFLLCSFVVVLALAGCGAQEETYTENKKGLEAVSEAVGTIQADFPDNADAKGWLLFPGTEIDNVVMQAADNSYYLRRDEKGAYSIWGCYFADYEADLTASGPSRNTVIYGHSSLDDETEGKKFTELKKLNLFDGGGQGPQHLQLSGGSRPGRPHHHPVHLYGQRRGAICGDGGLPPGEQF